MSPSHQAPSGDGLGFVLHHVAHAMTREFELELDRFGVRVVHLSVLRVLSSDGPCSQQHLADRLGLRRSTMVAVVRELVERGYVDRASKDRRAYSLSLTEAGQRFHGEVLAFAIDHERRAFAALTVRERATLVGLLRKLGSGGPRPRMLDGHGDAPTR